MSDRQARKDVNDAIISTGSAGIGLLVDAGNSSKNKRKQNKEKREQREAQENSMDTNEPIELVHEVQKQQWVNRVNDARVAGKITTWVSSLHPKNLECRLEGNFLNGSYNLSQKLRFSDGSVWLLRMPIVGNVSEEYADEKVAIEVEVLSILHQSDVPVPRVMAWGLKPANPLDLGPYIVMEFIEGISVNTLLRQHPKTRLIKEDIPDDDIELLYRQFARILLRIFQLNFPRLGSLPTPVTSFHAPVRPLTFKVHDILQTGGVDTFADYFSYLTGQDWCQFRCQPNSGGGPFVTKAKYAALCGLQAVASQLIEPTHAADDLTVVGVVDLEWSYAGPAQLFGSAPWWLLQDRLNNWDTFLDKEEAPRVLESYLRHLDMFKTVLEEEERGMPGQTMELSRLVKWSEESGSMWLHMLLSWGFNHPDSLPFKQLQAHLGREQWDKLREIPNQLEAIKFTERKLGDLSKYDELLEEVESLYKDVENGKMTPEAFVAVVAELNNKEGDN
ncbi:hypothetical protein DV735_g3921, partial [Chaetothyriales sp. CBS 134920]